MYYCSINATHSACNMIRQTRTSLRLISSARYLGKISIYNEISSRRYSDNVCKHGRRKNVHISIGQHHRLFHHSRPSNMAKRLFEEKEHANLYSQYRPTYPDEVYTTIVDYFKAGKGEHCGLDLAVDVGCGNGQSSRPLCKYFKQVIGCDVSEEQIASAAKDAGNLTLHVGPGEDLSFLEDNSVDVVTVAQALHWLDRDVFYREVERVLKPGGVFAAYGYGQNELDHPEAEERMMEFYDGLLGSYWDQGRRHIEDRFKAFEHPFADSTRIDDSTIAIRKTMPIDAYIGYLSTWSGWRKYLKDHPGSPALEQVRDRFNTIYREKAGAEPSTMAVVWPVFMLIGRKPR